VVGGQIAQKAPEGCGMGSSGPITERRGKRLRGAFEEWLQGMMERTVASHDLAGGTRRICCETARAYC
jgi:hypothetical protein